MSLSRLCRFPVPAIGGLAVAAALLLSAEPAAALQPGSKLWPRNIQGASAPLSAPRSPAAAAAQYASPGASRHLNVVVTSPAPASTTESVTLRGPDGTVRTFPLEGGRGSVVVRQVTVQPGERLTFTLPSFTQPRRPGAGR